MVHEHERGRGGRRPILEAQAHEQLLAWTQVHGGLKADELLAHVHPDEAHRPALDVHAGAVNRGVEAQVRRDVGRHTHLGGRRVGRTGEQELSLLVLTHREGLRLRRGWYPQSDEHEPRDESDQDG